MFRARRFLMAGRRSLTLNLHQTFKSLVVKSIVRMDRIILHSGKSTKWSPVRCVRCAERERERNRVFIFILVFGVADMIRYDLIGQLVGSHSHQTSKPSLHELFVGTCTQMKVYPMTIAGKRVTIHEILSIWNQWYFANIAAYTGPGVFYTVALLKKFWKSMAL